MKDFTEFIQNDCGGHPIRDILDNLTDEQIEQAIEEYANIKTKAILKDIKQSIDYLEGNKSKATNKDKILVYNSCVLLLDLLVQEYE